MLLRCTRPRSRPFSKSASALLRASNATKILMVLQRHMHEDEEIRYILDGSGFFDVRGESCIDDVVVFSCSNIL